VVSLETFRKAALELPCSGESIHFGRLMFCVGKANFASFDPRKGELALRLPLADPARREGLGRGILAEIPGKYGAEGWTLVDLERVEKTEFVQYLRLAHAEVSRVPESPAPRRRRKG
jgi:hypothetical protein